VKICPVCSTEYADDVRFCPNDGQTLRASSPAHDLVGQVIADRYHVVKKLGEGGMGQVYLAEHVKMGRKSAIKVMNPAMAHDPDAVARFNREAANASRISHANVCAIYDFGETPEGLIYLAMEFIAGEPLTDVMEREGALPLRRAVSIFVQVADALQAAHDLGIVHRDLKPDNIMLTRSRDGADVAAVVGVDRRVGPVAPLPATRGDAEGKTQRLSAPQRKRSLVPIIAGAVLLLGGGGAAVAVLAGGGRKTDGAVRPDTVPQRATGNPPPANPQPRTGGGARTGVDPAKAGALLDWLIDQPTSVIFDSALAVYSTPGVKVKDRAFAACMLAQAYSTEKDDAKALEWATRGLRLDPSLTSCKQITHSSARR